MSTQPEQNQDTQEARCGSASNSTQLLEDDADEEFQCWCGAKGTYESLHDSSGLDRRCRGSGILYCYCGGDLCVCHHHGEVDCLGCSDCEDQDDDDLFYDDEYL